MMKLFRRWSSISATLLAFGVTAGAATPVIIAKSVSAQMTNPTTPTGASPSPSPTAAANFSDVPATYWAQPFIQALAAQNIITGFPNGMYRPDEPGDRAEFAARLASAFDAKPVRELSESGFKDVPADYWAASVVKEAYEAGFVQG